MTCEINDCRSDTNTMESLYARMLRNILDVFSEYNVQIMTPAHVPDPVQPKIVPKDRCYTAPAMAPGREKRQAAMRNRYLVFLRPGGKRSRISPTVVLMISVRCSGV